MKYSKYGIKLMDNLLRLHQYWYQDAPAQTHTANTK